MSRAPTDTVQVTWPVREGMSATEIRDQRDRIDHALQEGFPDDAPFVHLEAGIGFGYTDITYGARPGHGDALFSHLTSTLERLGAPSDTTVLLRREDPSRGARMRDLNRSKAGFAH